MIHILSIDWDYYINTSNEIRNTCFPDIPMDILTEKEREDLWEPYYEDYEIENIGVLDEELRLTKEVIADFKKYHKSPIFNIHDSHRYMYDLVKLACKENVKDEVNVYNIDHHHDMYHYRQLNEKVNCGNWAEILQEELNDQFLYNWIKRNDSEEFTISGKVQCKECAIEEITDQQFDALYLCRSGAWSPPHLDVEYHNLEKYILN